MWAEVALPLPIEHLFTYTVPEKFLGAVRIGQPVLVPFRNRFLNGIIVNISSANPVHSPVNRDAAVSSEMKGIHAILNPAEPVPLQLLNLTRWIAEKYACSWGEALAVVFSSWGRQKNFACRDESRSDSSSFAEEIREIRADKSAAYSLTEEQLAALKKIKEAILNCEPKIFLLFGVTSSGKTEIYIQAIETFIGSGQKGSWREGIQKQRQALFLVPEISLCSPLFEILRRFFGDRVGMWHSQMSRKEKNLVAEKIRSGSVDIVVGARSALFAPLSDLGIIILDEEHDHSYKQQEKPRYHAREVALKLAELHGAVTILGSATPSIESFYRAEKKEFTLLKLSRRVPMHSLPQVRLVDKRSFLQWRSPFSEALTAAISHTLAKREQAILALNRRGYSTHCLCSGCGFVWKCSLCQLALVHHQSSANGQTKDYLRCHHCFIKMDLPVQCENCQAKTLLLRGAGTQKIVQEIKKLFPYARVLRLDRDVARKQSIYSNTYKTFQSESADILVGTQMVTQGFDFPRVTLVGIIDADTALVHPDFRAAEKTFQWVCQAAGRAGRSPLGGEVFVQSSLPEHYALQSSSRLDFELFYKQELEYRRALFFPPFSKLVLFKIESRLKKELVPKESEKLAEKLKAAAVSKSLHCGEEELQKESSNQRSAPAVQILGPGPAPREFLRKQTRWQILVKCSNDAVVSEVVRLGRHFVPSSKIKITVDVDPYEML